jgi:hypothetical protein
VGERVGFTQARFGPSLREGAGGCGRLATAMKTKELNCFLRPQVPEASDPCGPRFWVNWRQIRSKA